jgi:DNA-binding CsgD family transcriptional regulator
MKKSELEIAFDTQFKRLADGLPTPEPDYKFHPTRKWRIDRAFVDHKLAVEIEGGSHPRPVKCHNCGSTVRARKGDKSLGRQIRIGGGHTASRYLKDKEKYNALVEEGWYLLRYTHDDIHGDPFSMVEQIRVVLASRGAKVKLIEKLSNREREVLLMTAAGFSAPEIAERLERSRYMVRGKIQDACEKLVVRNRTAAVARAIDWGLIDPGDIPWPGEGKDLIPLQ